MTSLPASVSPAGLEAPGGPETPDGAMLAGLPPVWLRFNCGCPLCRDPVSGQRLAASLGDGFHAAAMLRARAAAFYTAYRAFADLLSSPVAMLTVRLRPGDCAVFDNTRVLHARTFDRGGRRHLQGCDTDLDGLESGVAVGERVTTDDTRRKDRI